MMHDDGDLILVHDCDHPERIGVWERRTANVSYQIQQYIQMRKARELQERQDRAKLAIVMVLIAAVAIAFAL